MLELKGRVAVLTGATGNLGRAAVEAFRRAGATVVLVDRSEERLARTFADLESSPEHLLAGDVDLTDEASAKRACQAAVERFGRIDVLFNTVGLYRGGTPVAEDDLSTWDLVLDVNLRTTLLMCRAAVPYLLGQRSGRIINTTSRNAFRGAARAAAYSAAKAAVLRLTESLAAEVKDSGVNVNCLVPGTIDTPENREASPEADTSRWVAPAAIADVAVFLASDAARAVTGAAIPVYGRS